MADRSPVVSLSTHLVLQNLGRGGQFAVLCSRCGFRMRLSSEPMAPLEPPEVASCACPSCGLWHSYTLLPPWSAPVPTRPAAHAAPAAPAGIPIRPPADPREPTMEEDGYELPLLTLAAWQLQGVAPPELHPNTAARVPRASDERPGRRDQHDRRLYSYAEIQRAVELHQQQLGQQLQDHDQAAADADDQEVQP